MEKFYLHGGDFRVSLCRFLPACQCLVLSQLLHHLLVNHRFQFGSDDFSTAQTAFIGQSFRTAEVLLAGRIEDTHKHIPAVFVLTFSRQPCMSRFLDGLDFHAVHQLLATGQPCFRWDNAFMGSQHQHLVF